MSFTYNTPREKYNAIVFLAQKRDEQIRNIAAETSRIADSNKYISRLKKTGPNEYDFDPTKVNQVSIRSKNSYFIPGDNPLRPRHNSHCYVSLNTVFRAGIELKHCEPGACAKFKKTNINAAGQVPMGGHLHPLLKVRAQFREILLSMGFNEMPTNRWVESSFWNFDSLF